MEALEAGLRDAEGIAGDVAQDATENVSKDVAEDIDRDITTQESANNLASDVAENGDKNAEDLTNSIESSGNKKPVTAAEATIANKAEKNGLPDTLNETVENGNYTPDQKTSLRATSKGLDDPDKVAELKNEVKNPSTKAKQFFESLKKNWGKLLVSGVTITVVVVWLARG